MAGNVTAAIVADNLVITGDVDHNAFDLSGTTLTGLDDANGQPTSINGVPNGTFSFAGLIGNAIIQTGDGNDVITYTNLVLPGPNPGVETVRDWIVDMGAGNDRLTGGGLEVWQWVINMGAGDDFIETDPLGPTNFTRSVLHVTLGEGGNQAFFNKMNVFPNVYVFGGSGFDGFALNDSTVGVAIIFEGGDGYDTVNLRNTSCEHAAILNCGDGIATVIVDTFSVLEGTMSITTGVGNDFVFVSRSFVKQILAVDLGTGRDIFEFSLTQAHSLSVAGGEGNDFVLVDRSAVESLFATLGDGDDEMYFLDSALGNCSLDGQGGRDTVAGRGSLFRALSFVNFEVA